ncbi:MAG: hypothetical protein K2F64_06650 [Muribaculaceae bacterium]|nr:hypothetical protein [Muribaculaceae bacterium]
MANYKSKDVSLNYSAEVVFNKLSNLESLKEVLANVPREKVKPEDLAMLDQIEVTPDTISFPAGPVGSLTLRMTRKEAPVLLRLEGENSPVPMSLEMNITPEGENHCSARVVIDLQIPKMLAPMVSGPLNKMTEQFADMLAMIPFDR